MHADAPKSPDLCRRPLSVVVLDGERGLAYITVRCLVQARNISVHVLSQERWTPLRLSRHRQGYEVLPDRPGETGYLEAVVAAIERSGADVLLPVAEAAVEFAAANRVPLERVVALPPVPRLEALRTATDKWLFAQFAEKHALPAPETIEYSDDPGFVERLYSLEYPVLVKPRHGEGGKGIRRFERPRDAMDYLKRCGDGASGDGHIVQSYIAGHDIDCSVLCRDGEILAHTIQQPVRASKGFAPPAAIEFMHNEAVLDVAQRWVEASRWSGVAHLDMRRTADGRPILLEVNARYWTSLQGSMLAGVNFPYLACIAALDIPFKAPDYRHVRYADVSTALRPNALWLLRREATGPRLGLTPVRRALGDPLAAVLHLRRRTKLSKLWPRRHKTASAR